jgi:competence ComEA-like helix-hairpin-helix protein
MVHRTSFLLCFLGAAFGLHAQALPESPGKEAFTSICSQCHELDVITPEKRSEAAWKQTVAEMRDKGAAGSDQDFAAIVTYLAKNFGTDALKPGAPATISLPVGPGKQFILTQCTNCHQPDHFTKYRHTPEEWQVIITRMGTRLPGAGKQDLDAVLQFFVTNYPTGQAPDDPTKVNMNKATAKDLESRLNLTAAEAAAVVQYRETHGDFKEWKDMLIIYGVNGKKIQALQARMWF